MKTLLSGNSPPTRRPIAYINGSVCSTSIRKRKHELHEHGLFIAPKSPEAGVSSRTTDSLMASLTMAPRKPFGHVRLTNFLHELSEWTKGEFMMSSNRVFGYKFHKSTRVVILYTPHAGEFQPGEDACVVFPEKDWSLFYKFVWKDLNSGGEEPLYISEWDGVARMSGTVPW